MNELEAYRLWQRETEDFIAATEPGGINECLSIRADVLWSAMRALEPVAAAQPQRLDDDDDLPW